MAAARKLTNEHKVFIITRLACYDSPREVADELKQEYGIELTPQGTEAYDPNKRAGKNLAKTWRELFAATRKAFLEDVTAHVPEANKAVRIRALANSAKALKQRGNHLGAAQLLEQISKEMGNVYTNRRELTGKDGKAVEMDIKHTDLTDEQLDRRIQQLYVEAGMAEQGNADSAGNNPTTHH